MDWNKNTADLLKNKNNKNKNKNNKNLKYANKIWQLLYKEKNLWYYQCFIRNWLYECIEKFFCLNLFENVK